MSNPPEWTSRQFSEALFDLDRSGFAFEFLRRNEEYRADYRRHQRSPTGSGVSAPQFATKWGLVFPG